MGIFMSVLRVFAELPWQTSLLLAERDSGDRESEAGTAPHLHA